MTIRNGAHLTRGDNVTVKFFLHGQLRIADGGTLTQARLSLRKRKAKG